jgi:hypothetical protein
MLWKKQNARDFGDTRRKKNVDQMLQENRDEFHLWERAKRGRSLDVARE